MKITKEQKIVIGLSVVAYCMVLYGFVMQDMPVLFVSIVANSILPVIYILLNNKEETDHMEDSMLLSEANNRIREHKETIERLNATIKDNEGVLSNALKRAQQAEEEKEKISERALKDAGELVKLEREKLLEELAGKAERDGLNVLPPLALGNEDGEVDIVGICRECVGKFSEAARKLSVSLKVSVTEDVIKLRADKNRMAILFSNIIDNSLKYMNKTGSLVITISKLGEDVFIVLKDNGEGLSRSEIGRIFELNYQGSNRISGNGLGLFQAKAIVEHYSGNIYARSDSGAGMGIYIQLPSGE